VIRFGEYLPDQPAFGNPGATVANNVIPTAMGYRELSAISAFSTTPLNARARGAGSGQASDGAVYLFAGDGTSLYRLNGAVFDETNDSYTLAEDTNWQFAQFGDTMIAVCRDEAPQKWTLGSSTSWSALGGSPPKARHVAVVRGFVMLGDAESGGTSYQNRVYWSGLDNAETWTPSQTTQADFNDFVGGGGAVTGLVGGEFGLVFQDRSIFRLDYQGTPLIFSSNEVSQSRGTQVSGSIAALGRMVFFWSDDGFYMLEDGTKTTAIGANKVDKTFANDFDQAYLSRVTSAIDPINHLYIVSYPGSGHTSGTPNKLIMYDWVNNKWSTGSFSHEIIARTLTSGYTLEGLDAIVDSSTGIDGMAFSLDSRAWMGGRLQLTAFDTSHNLARFTGTGLAATIETSEFQPLPGRRSFINKVRPVIEGSDAVATVQMANRNKGTETASFGSAVSLNTSGDAPVREDNRYHRVRVNISGGFDHAQGCDVTWKGRGAR